MSVLNQLKWNYNHNLIRYYKGCIYIKKHKNETDKWLPELLDILDNINLLLNDIRQICEVSTDEILKGFDTKGE